MQVAIAAMVIRSVPVARTRALVPFTTGCRDFFPSRFLGTVPGINDSLQFVGAVQAWSLFRCQQPGVWTCRTRNKFFFPHP